MFFFSQRNQCGIVLTIDFHIRQYVSHQSQPALRISIVHLSINIILINSFRQQFAYNKVNLTVIGIIRKPSGIGHHTCIDTFGTFTRNITEIPHTTNQTENKFGSGRNFRMRNDDPTKIFRIKVMINQDFTGGGSCYRIRHFLNTFQRIKVETTNNISLVYQFISKLLIAVIEQNIFTARHPFQEIGKSVGYNNIDGFIL